MPPSNYAVRLRLPYDELRQAISAWALECSKVVAYEHPEDGNVHCHLALMGYYGSKQHLKDVLHAHGLVFTPQQWSFKETFKAPRSKECIDITDATLPGYITYMSKGKYAPSYVKGVSYDICEKQRLLWVQHQGPETKSKSVDRKLLDDFSNMMLQDQINNTIGVEIRDPQRVRSIAFTYAIAQNDGVINMNCRKMAKMLSDSYSYNSKYVTVEDLILPFEPLTKPKK